MDTQQLVNHAIATLKAQQKPLTVAGVKKLLTHPVPLPVEIQAIAMHTEEEAAPASTDVTENNEATTHLDKEEPYTLQ